MKITTFFYEFNKIIWFKERKNVDALLVDGLLESFEPSENTIKNIMSFSNAYRCNKSNAIGQTEYLIN